MSRPKGSKNKPLTDAELLKMLHERGIPIADSLIPDSGIVAAPKQAKKPAPVASEVSEVSNGIVREKFALTLNTPQSDKLQQTIYRCGNRLCNKVLPEALHQCPFCGVYQTWQ